jgi:phosphohistidine phosphatase
MLLYFLRHAEAEDIAETDFDRRLTERGRGQAEKVAKFILKQNLKPSVILASPVTRAKQTAHLVSDTIEADMVKLDWLACGMDPEVCLRELEPYAHHPTIMLVGHEPDFSATIGHLLGAPDSEALHIRKASLTLVDLPELKAGAGRLEFSIPCKLM